MKADTGEEVLPLACRMSPPAGSEEELQCGASLTQAAAVGVLAEGGAVGGVPVPLEHGLELLLDAGPRGLGRSLVHHQRRPGRVQEVVTGPV